MGRDAIVALGAAELARRIRSRELSSREVVSAFVEQATAVNPQLNAIVVPRYEQALQAAQEADDRQARGETLGPLHGVPVTIKDCFHLPGTPAAIGLAHLARQLSTSEAPHVARLRSAGAIVLGKTNVPQLMLLHETDNPVYGRTNNPWNLERTCGGSSGGEAAIIAARGSPLGLGTDLGGSIRIPAHFCGVCGLKASNGRLTRQGTVQNFRGLESLQFQPGPLGRRVEDLELLLEVLTADAERSTEFDVVPARVRQSTETSVQGLRIGYWEDNGYFPASPAIRRAVREAVTILARQGAIVEPYPPPKVSEAMFHYTALLGADGFADARRLLAGGPAHPRVSELLLLGWIPNWLRPLAAFYFRLTGAAFKAGLVNAARRRSADEFWQLTYRMNVFRRQFLADFAARFDALLLPPYSLPAAPHGLVMDTIAAAGDTFLINLLGLPAGCVPITQVRADEESDRPQSRELAARTALAIERGSAGLPVGVQVVSHYWREDIVLAVMKALETPEPLAPPT